MAPIARTAIALAIAAMPAALAAPASAGLVSATPISQACDPGPGARCAKAIATHGQFKGADLRKIDLRGARVRHADFRGADLRGARFHGADLRHADFRGARLHGAVFHGVKAHHADFRGASLKRARFGRMVIPPRPGAARANQPTYSGAVLRGADLQGVDLDGATFQFADLTGANLVDADLTNTWVDGGSFNQVDARGSDWGGTQMVATSFRGANLAQADFAQALVNLVNLTGTNVSQVNLDETFFTNCTCATPALGAQFGQLPANAFC